MRARSGQLFFGTFCSQCPAFRVRGPGKQGCQKIKSAKKGLFYGRPAFPVLRGADLEKAQKFDPNPDIVSPIFLTPLPDISKSQKPPKMPLSRP